MPKQEEYDNMEDDDIKVGMNVPAIETAVSHVAYDYYMSYIKDNMEVFKEASELLDIATFQPVTYPNMIAYVNYCKVTAANEILSRLIKRDFKLREPKPVMIDESFNELINDILFTGEKGKRRMKHIRERSYRYDEDDNDDEL